MCGKEEITSLVQGLTEQRGGKIKTRAVRRPPVVLHLSQDEFVCELQNIYRWNQLMAHVELDRRCNEFYVFGKLRMAQRLYLSGTAAFFLFPALTSRHVLASWGDLSRHGDGREADSTCMCSGRQTDCWKCRGQERSGHHTADSSDLFLISPTKARRTDRAAC